MPRDSPLRKFPAWQNAPLPAALNRAQCHPPSGDALHPLPPSLRYVEDLLHERHRDQRGDDREMGRWLNNRAENSHLPFRRREWAMLRFRRMRKLQKFGSFHATAHIHVSTAHHFQNRNTKKRTRTAALMEWRGPDPSSNQIPPSGSAAFRQSARGCALLALGDSRQSGGEGRPFLWAEPRHDPRGRWLPPDHA